MTTKTEQSKATEEQPKGTEEQVVAKLEDPIDTIMRGLNVDDASKESEDASKETTPASSETSEADEEKPAEKSYTQAEYDSLLSGKQKEWQASKDTELKSAHDVRLAAEKQVKELRLKLDDKGEDARLAALAKAEVDNFGETTELKTLQEVRTELTSKTRELRNKEAALEEQGAVVEKSGKVAQAFTEVMDFIYANAEKATSDTVKAMVTELAGAEGKGHRALILEKFKTQYAGFLSGKATSTASVEAPQRPNPDQPVHNAPGGVNLNALAKSPEEQIAWALAHPKK